MKTTPLTGNEIIIRNKKYDNGVEIKLDDIRRDKTGEITRKVSELAIAAADLKVQLVDDLLTYGDTSTLGLAFDGANFFSASHSFGASGTVKNLLTTADVGQLIVTSLTKVTPEEAAVAMMGMISYMMSFLDDQGRPINQNSMDWTVGVPPRHYGAFQTAASANQLAGGQTNPLSNTFNVTVIPVNTDWTVEFFVANTGDVNKPFIIQEEQPLDVQMFDETNDAKGTRERQTAIVHALWQGGSGYGDWRKMAKGTLATS
jgi:hypothetical protein